MSLAEDRRLKLARRFEASPERLFDAWTDPGQARGWLFTTSESESHTVEMDRRVGGRWKIVDRRAGVDYTAIGEYLEIDRPRLLAFTFGMPQFSPAFTKVTVEIVADGDGAVMTLTQEGLPPDAIPAAEEGWASMFDALARQLAGGEKSGRRAAADLAGANRPL